MTTPASRVDLNLFRVLDAVHEHGGISGAARHLHLSQPAVSHALARLRRLWGDPLFVRHGNQMVPTELTRRVIGEVQAHLRGLQACLAQADAFDPRTLNMTLRLGMRDVLEAITLPPLMARLAEVAPGVRLSSVRVPRETLERALTLGEVDLVIDRQRRVSARVHGEPLAQERLAVILRQGHPALQHGLSVSDYFQASHVMVTLRPDQDDPLQAVWDALGLGTRRVTLRCQHYFAAAKVVAHSDALLTLPHTYAEQLAQTLPLTVCELPVPVPPIAIWMYWHADREGDPVHRWMRESVAQGARDAMQQMHDLR
ncbi:MAG TPA: LysR family transcriptional regulator [Aquabacterium sp.]|uniref:LysR family transcriptional regulator n=1 Tax=Aquabacterium sp. TaxID=1872578 RepID=UPI002E30AECC|nr:LysR family transcriptional regulator [Aquabacterium sp.]HEX5373802.1 LysR family transcriptional regulator [Aquabacterium sp.]